MEKPSGDAPSASALPAAAALLAGSVLLSRLLGYVREALLAHLVGAGARTDAYYAAFQIPDLLNYLLAGGALSIAFLPLYTARRGAGDEAGAERLLATVLGTLGALALVATALLWWWSDPLVAFQFRGFDADTRALTARLTRIALPAQIFFVLGGILQATLFARGRFAAAALAPLLYNGSMIGAALLLAPRIGVEAFVWGALVGSVLGPFLVPWLDARRRVRIRLRVAPADRDFLRYLAVAAPLMLGVTLLTVDEWYGRWFGSLLGEGAVASLGYARRLMLVPVAVVGQALAAAALPTLAHLFAAGRHDELNRTVDRTLAAGLSLGVLAGAATFALAEPLVGFVYQHGAFTASDAARVTTLLRLLALAVPAWVAQQIAARAFYARGDTWRPMLLGTGFALAAIPLYLALGKRFGVAGLAMAGALGMNANALAILALARRLHGAPRLGALGVGAGRALAVGAAAGAAALFGVGDAGAGLRALGVLMLGGAVFAAAGAAGVALFGGADLRAVLRGVGRRLVRRRRPA